MIPLSNRLKTVASLVTPGKIVADIGCDHAYTAIYLMKQGIAEKVCAMDVKEGPLGRARENILQYGCKDQIHTRLSDGLEALAPGEADTLLLSGMGGRLMVKILEAGWPVTETAGELVLQPQTEWDWVRHSLHRMGFAIAAERMLKEDGKFYTVIKAKRGREQYNKEIFYRFGKYLLLENGSCIREYLETEKSKKEWILKQMEEGGLLESGEQYEKIKSDWFYIIEAVNGLGKAGSQYEGQHNNNP